MKGKIRIIALCGIAALGIQTGAAATTSEIRAVAEEILEGAQTPFVQGRDQSQAWVSGGWLLIKAVDSEKLEATDVSTNKTTWVDAASFSQGESARIISAIRLHDGFLLSGLEEPSPGTVYSGLIKYDAQGTNRISLRLGQYADEGHRTDQDLPLFKILNGVELPDGRIAVFWIGKRDTRSHHIQLGAAFMGPDLVIDAGNIYGPVDLGSRYLKGGGTPDRKVGSDIQLDGNRLYVVDAFSNRLLIFDLQGTELARLDLKDPSGDNRPIVVKGWSIDDHGIHFLVTTREHPGDPIPHLVYELISYRRNGKFLKTTEMTSVPALRGSDTGESFIFIQGSVFKGTVK